MIGNGRGARDLPQMTPARIDMGDVEIERACQEARRLARSLGDVRELIRALCIEHSVHSNRADLAGAERISAELFRVAEQHGDATRRWSRRSCARTAGGAMRAARAKSITDLAKQEGVTDAYVCRLLPLTCLAPEILGAILDGRQPKGLRLAEMLLRGKCTGGVAAALEPSFFWHRSL
jgi:hypothetical protein